MKFRSTLIFFSTFLVFCSVLVSASEKGNNWERDCDGRSGECTQKFYSTQKYYYNGGIWKDINENWTDQGCLNGYEFCVIDNLNNYEVHVKRNLNTPIAIAVITPDDEDYIYYRPDRLEDDIGETLKINANSHAYMSGDELIFNNIFDNADLVLRYLPHKLKEELILYRPPFNVTGNLSFITKTTSSFKDMRFNETIGFYKDGILKAEIEKPEELGNGREIGLGANGREIKLTVDYQSHNFSKDGELILDPSTVLNFSNIMIDADITLRKRAGFQNTIGFLTSGTTLRLGITGCTTDNSTFRAGFDWNLSSLPEGVTVTEIKIEYTVGTVEPNSKFLAMTNLSFHLKNIVLPNLNQFNEALGNDYGFITSVNPSTQRKITLTSSAIGDFENSINGDDIFSHGLNNLEQDNSLPICPTTDTVLTRVVASEHPTASFRPKLYVTYGFAPKYFDLNVTPESPQIYNGSNTANFTINVTDEDGDISTVILSIDGSNFTATNNATLNDIWNVTINNTLFNHIGSYSYYWFMNDTLGLNNQTSNFIYKLTGSDWELAIVITFILMGSTSLNIRRTNKRNEEDE